MRRPPSIRTSVALAMVVLAVMTAWTFAPNLNFEFVELDDQQQIIDNPWIRGLTAENLTKILTSRCLTSYYPVRTLTYALNYQFWGLNPLAFKLTGGLIHLANVMLVFWLAMRLFRWPPSAECALASGDVLPAAFGAALLAVHPVVVEPVAWVSGREELLMTLGALGCLHFHITARQLGGQRRAPVRKAACHVAAVLCCAAACLSNVAGAVVPLLVTAWDLLTARGPSAIRRLATILAAAAPLWAVGAATIAIKTVCEFRREYQPAELGMAEALFEVVGVYFLNLKTLVWPVNLGVYPPGIAPNSAAELPVVLGAAAIAATIIALWIARKQTPVVFGLLWFLLALAPASQILPTHIQRADRFLYLPLAGLAIAAASILRRLASSMARSRRIALAIAGILAVTAMCVASSRQLPTWRNTLSMWENSVRINPSGYVANCALAENLAIRGRYAEAIERYRIVLQTAPGVARALDGLARLLVLCPDQTQRDYELAVRLADEALLLDTQYFSSPLFVRTRYGKHLADKGQFQQAMQQLYAALDLHPDYEPALLQMAELKATCADPRLRDPGEAVRLAERAGRSAEPTVEQYRVLAIAYASAGRFDSAVEAVEQGLSLGRSANEPAAVERLDRQLERYRNRMP